MTEEPVVPTVPPGPGVRPPFVAPPAQRDQRRMWIRFSIAAVAVVVVCTGAVAGCIGIGVWLGVEQQSESEAAVRRYLDPLVAGQYSKAYEERCTELRDQETAEEYATRVADRPKIVSYKLGTVAADPDSAGGMGTTVTVNVRYASGAQDVQLRVAYDSADREYAVCGGEV